MGGVEKHPLCLNTHTTSPSNPSMPLERPRDSNFSGQMQLGPEEIRTQKNGPAQRLSGHLLAFPYRSGSPRRNKILANRKRATWESGRCTPEHVPPVVWGLGPEQIREEPEMKEEAVSLALTFHRRGRFKSGKGLSVGGPCTLFSVSAEITPLHPGSPGTKAIYQPHRSNF